MRVILKLIIVFISSIISACTVTNPKQYQEVLHKSQHFKRNYFVCATKSWRPWDASITLIVPGELCGSSNPTLEEYFRNPSKWQKWYTIFGESNRILGVVGKNDTYRIEKVIAGYEFSQFEVILENAPFKEMKVSWSWIKSNSALRP